MNEFETIDDVVLACITFAGRNEDDLLADYERRCKCLKIIPLYGQVKAALKRLHVLGKVKVINVQGHKLCCKTR